MALSEILSLAAIPNVCYDVVNKEMFDLAIDCIIHDIKQPNRTLGSVTLHFSMHGNEHGVGLTSGEFVSWEDLYLLIRRFNDSIGYGEVKWAAGKKYSFANLNFSVCHGYNAIALKQYGDASPFTTLLGPTREVNWSDSLIAFATYYHLTIHKGATWWEAVPLMNYASGSGSEVVFKLQVADGLYTKERPILD